VDVYPLLENINGTLLVLLMFKQTVGMWLLRLVCLMGKSSR
jgi:hypothetical protein